MTVNMQKLQLAFLVLLKDLLALTLIMAINLGAPGLCQAADDPAKPVAESGSSESLTLEQAVDLGLKSNLDILAAKFAVPLAEADEVTAGLWNNFSVMFDAIFQPLPPASNWNQSSAGGPRQNDIVLSYPLDLSGKRSKAQQSAHEAVNIAKVSFEDAIRLKIQDIRLAYIEVITQEHQLLLTQEKVATLRNLVTMTENRVGTGKRLPLLLMRAQLAWDQAKLDNRQREISQRAALVQLSTLLAKNPQEPKITVQTKLRDFKLMEIPEKEKLVDQALAIRPDLNALRLVVKKSDFDTELARAQIWDNFVVTAGYSTQGPVDAKPDGSSAMLGLANSWDASITIPLPTFNRNQGNIQKALLTKSQTEKQIEAKAMAIRQEIDGLYDQLKLGRGLIEDYENHQLMRAREVRDAQQKQFGTGNSALLDYLDAVSAYQGTVSAYYDAVAEYRRNLARLSASVGKDF